MFGGDDTVIYWKCESGQMLKEVLLIPVTNMIKERALILAAQQVMLSHCSDFFFFLKLFVLLNEMLNL